MKTLAYRTMAYLHFGTFGLCTGASITDLVTNNVTFLTPTNFALAALNLALGVMRLELK